MKLNSVLSQMLDFDELAGLKYFAGSTRIYRLHPLVKLGLLLAFTVSVLALAEIEKVLLLFILLLAAYISSGLGWRFWLRKLRFILFFAAFIFLIQLFARQQGLPLLQIPVGPWNFVIWSGGLLQGLLISLRFLNLIGISFLFVATTDPLKLVQALIQAGLPYRWGFMLITALRFIPGYQDDFRQIRLAIRLKGIRYEGFSLSRLLNMLRYLLIPLLSTTINRVDTLSMSMDGRAFGLYNKRTFAHELPFTKEDIFVSISSALVLCLFWII